MEQIKDLNDNLSKSFKQLLDMNKDFLSNLTDEQRKQVLPIQNDINAILRAVKKGDILAINEIQKKYANTDIR
jgi:hypothetical protein